MRELLSASAAALAVFVALSPIVACGGTAEDSSRCVAPPAPRPGECPTTRLLQEACECQDESFDPSAAGEWACTPSGLVDKSPPPAPPEECNGLDDNGDGVADDGAACA